jgi:cytochrome c553
MIKLRDLLNGVALGLLRQDYPRFQVADTGDGLNSQAPGIAVFGTKSEENLMKRSAKIVSSNILALGILVAVAGGLAHAAAPDPGSSAYLRAALATPQDIAEGKRVAEASCASCHGLSGIAKSKDRDMPNIAGQRPGYLYQELRVYQVGGRGNTPMNNAVKFLSDDALIKVAAYYASVDPAQPAPAGGAKAGKPKSDPLSLGKAAAAGCAGCHGENGVTSTPGMPNLVGIDPKYLVAAVKAYKSGERRDDMMKTLVSAVTDAEIDGIALFYAMQKPAKAKTPSPGNQAAGKSAAVACAGCHGEGGVSTGTAPSLAGQDAQYFIAAMKSYKDGSRADEAMKAPAASVDDATVKNLAAYYANQAPQAPKVRKPLTLEEIAQRCDRCHGVGGNSTDPRSPALAAQRPEYLERVMRAYQTGERKSSAMTAMLDGLSEVDIKGLAAYYASQKARAVVYVPLPTK